MIGLKNSRFCDIHKQIRLKPWESHYKQQSFQLFLLSTINGIQSIYRMM